MSMRSTKDRLRRSRAVACLDHDATGAVSKYTAPADLPTATEKARRDAPAIAVCEM